MTDLDSRIDELVATATPRTRVVSVCARGDLVDRHHELQAAILDEAKKVDSVAGNPQIDALAAEIAEVEAAQESSTVEITVRSVSRRKWTDLLRDHPPRPDVAADRANGWNTDTFPNAAVALCTGLDIDRVRRLDETLPPGEYGKLFNAACLLNLELPRPKLAAATELARLSGASSTSADASASPAASS